MDTPTLPNSAGFSHLIDGSPAALFIIYSQDRSCICALTSYGARVVSLLVPDNQGKPTDMALGYSSLDEYLKQPEEYFGAIVGRCANRIAAGLFVLNGYTYALPINNGHNTLHGGPGGLHARLWEVVSATEHSVTFRYLSKDGEEGFPGNLSIEVTYEWTTPNTLSITYEALTDKATLVNLSNHTYFNLSGEGALTVLDHELQIMANTITPVDATLIPTGALMQVKNTPFDFTRPKTIGQSIEEKHDQLAYGSGYDHNFVLNTTAGKPAVIVKSPVTGITMSIATDRPGLQFYSGNFLDGSRKGKTNQPYAHRSAIALEPQGFPDAIHHPRFPSVVLKPDATYHSISTYAFTASSK